tara:strand:+ start:2414 stop:2791 length:378 start_codon:yes stop_codon:yes gene_type:complete
MTVFVRNPAEHLDKGVVNMIEAMIEDYKLFMPPDSEIKKKMNKRYSNSFVEKTGSKYIKVVSNNSVSAFIVKTDKDKKFKKGDILYPAGWAAPARNKARGNVLDGGYPINWTGPLYLRGPGQLLR